MTIILKVLRILFGLVFMFSGFVKAVDPVGFGYKLQEYLDAAGISGLDDYMLLLGILLSGLEFVIGFVLVLGQKLKLVSFLSFAFMTFFTVLTLLLAIYDPVKDCGCFGDAVKLTNWETFWKNVVMFIVVILLYVKRESVKTPYRFCYLPSVLSSVFILLVSWYSYTRAPIIDFRPYRVGVNLPASIEIPEGAAVDESDVTLIYEKDGVRKEFKLEEELPSEESGWEYVDQSVVLVQKGYVPPIEDFFVMSEMDGDITQAIVYGKGYHILAFSKQVSEISDPSLLKPIGDIYKLAQEKGVPFYFVTASDLDAVRELLGEEGIDTQMPLASLDETALKTITRSNPALLLIKDQEIVNKWHHRELPSTWEELTSMNTSCWSLEYTCYVVMVLLLLVCIPFKKKLPNNRAMRMRR